MESRYVQSRGLRYQYLHAGSPGKPPVVLLHGFPQTSHMWRHQIDALTADYEVFAPDTRGYGGTDKPRVRVTRSLLARDIVDFADAVGLDEFLLAGHDWGGIIASKVALDHGHRVRRLALFDTLTTVWIPWGIHGYWFKGEPLAEDFFAEHGVAFIRSLFGGEDRTYGGPPATPWAPVEGAAGSEALADFDPTLHWNAGDVDHYAAAFADPGAWFHAVSYYRHALPFHLDRGDGPEHLSSNAVAEMWNHEGLLFSHPEFGQFPVFGPEDAGRAYEGPAMYVYSPFLVPAAFEDGDPADDHVPASNDYDRSFTAHFPSLRWRGVRSGHFIPEEAPERCNELLAGFFAGQI